MENVPVTEQRSAVPDQFRQPAGKITPKQRDYILSLLEKKDLSSVSDADQRVDRLMKQLQISEDPEEIGLTKTQASEIISWLVGRSDKTPGDVKHSMASLGRAVPAGRYAVESNEGELRFYRLWRGTRNPNVFRLYVQHGPDESQVEHLTAVQGILRKIEGVGIREAALRYGHEIGACSNCGRRLTNRISRELAIGPVCGARMWSESNESWREEVAAARKRITDRGEDPDEELPD